MALHRILASSFLPVFPLPTPLLLLPFSLLPRPCPPPLALALFRFHARTRVEELDNDVAEPFCLGCAVRAAPLVRDGEDEQRPRRQHEPHALRERRLVHRSARRSAAAGANHRGHVR